MKSGATVMNRTGLSAAPEQAEAALAAASLSKPSASGGLKALEEARKPYIAEHKPIGSPPPDVGKNAPGMFIDKLGERLAFERGGTRLYQHLMGKMRANGKSSGGPSLGEVEHIMEEELEHFRILNAAIMQMGGDPTVQTTGADLVGVASSGLIQIVSDPRTTVRQCLEALLIAELDDNECWETLIKMAEGLGHAEMARKFEGALESEQEHLQNVRMWITKMTGTEAGMKVVPVSSVRSGATDRAKSESSSSKKKSTGSRKGKK
jgi:bacterioferritin (cytochrome b1)